MDLYSLVDSAGGVLAVGPARPGALSVVWLLMLPLKLIGITVDAVFKFLYAVLTLPARILRGPCSGEFVGVFFPPAFDGGCAGIRDAKRAGPCRPLMIVRYWPRTGCLVVAGG